MIKILRNRIGTVLLALVCLTIGLSGCSSQPTETITDVPTNTDVLEPQMVLAYTAADSLNPYFAKTQANQELATLMYDGLIVLKEGYVPEYRIASNIQNQGTTVTVTLSRTLFSDGSLVTPQDVQQCMREAMKAETLSYALDFQNVIDVIINEKNQLEIYLKHPDPYFINFLDFPVYKVETVGQENTDNKDLPPLGSGRYVYHEEAGAYWLRANPRWMKGAPKIKMIGLMNLPDAEAVAHAQHVGSIDWCYSDLSSNTFPSMNGKTKQVTLPNLVYLGANMHSGAMSNRVIRAGVSAALNRTAVAENAYFGVAKSASGPFTTNVKETEGLQVLSPTADTEKAIAFFEQAGYKTLNDQGYRVNQSGIELSAKIIYNRENSARENVATLIAAQLGVVGCKATISGLPYNEYKTAVSKGHYDLYVAEMAIPDNFDLYPLLNAGGLITLDVSDPVYQGENEELPGGEGADLGTVVENAGDNYVTARAANRYRNGHGSLTEVVSCLNQEFPIIPICHRMGMLIYDDSIVGEPKPLSTDPFFGIEHCTVPDES